MHKWEAIDEANRYIKERIDQTPTIGLILGSGLGEFANELADAIVIPYQDIPHFVMSTVDYHAGKLVIGKLEGKTVVAMQGRFHYYEGHSVEAVTFPIRVMRMLGVEQIILTNASGGLHIDQHPGDLMLVTDHINLMGINPLSGANDDRLGDRFPDMSTTYCKSLAQIAKQVAKETDVPLKEGVYVAFTGPSFETPAEVKMARLIGGDAVGMSTVPEVIVANHAGIKVLTISCICNLAAGILPQPITAEEVYEAAGQAKENFSKLLRGIVKNM
ncbi:purine-nucleoside phosphorylase [Brevibacterium sp. JNUCC-42]|nr:purine-nucleoside phosphorylase [Brevibacterium sp. JNUCC-42]